MNLWQQYNSYRISVLGAIQPGGTLEATLLAGLMLQFAGSGSNIQAHVYGSRQDGGSASNLLYNWQAQGVYTIDNPGMSDEQSLELRDNLFKSQADEYGQLISPVFSYAHVNGHVAPFYEGGRLTTASVDIQLTTASAQAYGELGMSKSSASNFGFFTSAAIQVASWKAKILGGPLVGGGMLTADLIASVRATKQAPRSYSNGWPTGADVSPYVELSSFSQ